MFSLATTKEKTGEKSSVVLANRVLTIRKYRIAITKRKHQYQDALRKGHIGLVHSFAVECCYGIRLTRFCVWCQ
jgi:hypothetical protein